jgi:hypothetical protein
MRLVEEQRAWMEGWKAETLKRLNVGRREDWKDGSLRLAQARGWSVRTFEPFASLRAGC